MIVDLHSHYFPLEAVRRLPGRLVQVAEGEDGSYLLTVAGQPVPVPLERRLVDLEQQRAERRRQGLDGWVLMIPPFTLLYELPAADGVVWARAINDAIAAAARPFAGELFGFATVPLQDVTAAVAELDRAVQDLGLAGVEIATSIAGIGLDTPLLDPFWGRCQALGVPVLIHPHYVSGADRMGDFHLRNLVGNPAETALASARLLFAGVLERYPDLRIVLSHGGGALPHLVGRLRQGFAVRPECRTRATAPIEQLPKLFYDTVVFDARVLRHLVEIVGALQVVPGSDYPFDMSTDDPVAFVRGAGLSAEEAATIVTGGGRLLAGHAGPAR